MKNDPVTCGGEDWHAGWEDRRKRQLTSALAASPAERLRWLEEVIALAHRTGALPRKRSSEIQRSG